MRIDLFGLVIYKEKTGMISPMPVWVCFESEYMYIEDTLPKLIWFVIKNWRKSGNIVG